MYPKIIFVTKKTHLISFQLYPIYDMKNSWKEVKRIFMISKEIKLL